MRPIKFRAWHKYAKEYRPVAALHWQRLKKTKKECGGCPRYGEIDAVSLPNMLEENDYLPEGIILEQFTGLRDAKGREIYEGDIITYGAGNLVIFEERGAFLYKNLEGATCLLGHHNNDVKVIGNIHEHVEFLGGKVASGGH